MKILFAASEAHPFFASGGLGDVAGSLPAALRKNKAAVRVVLPLYGQMQAQWRQQLKYITNFSVPLGWRNQYCGLFELVHGGVTYYFLDNEYYFKRQGIYGFYDDGERFAFFSRAILEALNHMSYSPDIIHCNDWQTALVPVYLNMFYRHIEKFSQTKAIFTIHNIQYQGKYGREILEETIGVSRNAAHIVEYDGTVNYMKGAIEAADRVSTVSPSYAEEILDPWYAYGLHDFLREKQYKLCGILNGIDIEEYNPATDPSIAQNYTAATAEEGKLACKADLRAEFGLAQGEGPIVGMVGRMVAAKGIELVRHMAGTILDSGMQLVVLGTGEAEYEEFFKHLGQARAGEVGVHIGFVPQLARKIYAGSDMFLMPSCTEPCGLAQMVALRYGTVPIVRQTGGLKDTIVDSGDSLGNGFTFATVNAYDMLTALNRANEGFANKEGWGILRRRAMECDFSWETSAKQYVKMYKEVQKLW